MERRSDVPAGEKPNPRSWSWQRTRRGAVPGDCRAMSSLPTHSQSRLRSWPSTPEEGPRAASSERAFLRGPLSLLDSGAGGGRRRRRRRSREVEMERLSGWLLVSYILVLVFIHLPFI